MIINPLPATANIAPKAEGSFDTLRSIKMRTLATPSGGMPVAENQETGDNKDKLPSDVEDTQPISPQFARLAKERRALQVKERELKAREEALASKPAEGQIPLARLKQEPLKVLLESGVTYDQLTEALLNNQTNPEFNALRAEVEALKEGVDTKFKDNATQQKQQVLAEMKREATQLVAQGDDYAFVREMGKIPEVMSLIERTYDDSGEVLDVTEALALIETELAKEVEKITSLGKVREKFMPQPQPMQQRQQGMRTLTNRDTASPPMSPKQRAMAAFYGTLKR